MFLNNFKNIQKIICCGMGASKADIADVIRTSGTIVAGYDLYPVFQKSSVSLMTDQTKSNYSDTASGNTYIGFGSGNTAVTIDDIKLESIISTISASTNTSSISVVTEGGKITRTLNINMDIKNTDSNQITIREIGIFQLHRISNGYSTGILVFREVLDSPIVLEVDQSVNVTKTLSYAQVIPEITLE